MSYWQRIKEQDPEKYKEQLARQAERAAGYRKEKKAGVTPTGFWEKEKKPKKTQAGNYQRNPRSAWAGIICGMRNRAAKKGIPFDETIDVDFMISICPTHCPILGLELKRATKDGGQRANSPSVDRLNPNAGYTRDNIIVVSYLANTIRNAAKADQIIAVGMFYKKLLDGLGIEE